MIKLNKKILTLITILTLSTSLFVSCGNKTNDSNSSSASINQSQEDKGQATTNEFLENIDMENALRNIKYLSDEIGPRYAGNESEVKASEYIKSEFDKMGYETSISKFTFTSFMDMDKELKESRNVQAVKKSNKENAEIIYITAHYDSVQVSPGANDNGSGVAAILEIANAIKSIESDKEIRFVAFGAEEEGLFGSQDYVAKLSEDEISRSVACFNLDMVATDYEPISELGVYTADGKTNKLTEEVAKAAKQLEGLSTEKVSYDGEFDCVNGEGVTASDHTSFTMRNIPAVLFINIKPEEKNVFKSLEPYYHTKDDNTNNFSSDRLERSIKLAGQAIYNMICEK